MIDKIEFTVLPDGRILDLRPMYSNKPPLVYKEGSWITYEGNLKEMLTARPIDSKQAESIASSDYPIQ